MTKFDFWFLIAVLVCSLVTQAINNYQREVIKELKQHLDQAYNSSNAILEYCLMNIIKYSVEAEDYETAERCKKAIDDLQKVKTNKNSNS